jgi:CRP/FNR family transcriptional regulator
MTQQQIAAHLGTSREVVARLLGQFVAAGLVATGRGTVRIVDAAGLAALIAAPL